MLQRVGGKQHKNFKQKKVKHKTATKIDKNVKKKKKKTLKQTQCDRDIGGHMNKVEGKKKIQKV